VTLLRGLFRLLLCAVGAYLVCQLPWWLISCLAVAGAIALVPALGQL
jgi:hypothetical protein